MTEQEQISKKLDEIILRLKKENNLTLPRKWEGLCNFDKINFLECVLFAIEALDKKAIEDEK